MGGKYYEELIVGEVIRHEFGRTLTEMDNVLFSSLTMNHQPLHINADFAAGTEFKRPLMNGLFTLGLVVGISVNDLTAGTIVANLGYEEVRHTHPLFAGDTLYAESRVLHKRISRSQPERGLVTLQQTGRNQDGVVCIQLKRTALFLMRPTGDA
ncbi:MAG: MaoC family dehydratase [Anaerolineaceae bacterium]|nr:MaoC family dehydratase [Anaerolineaceae bacterium]MCY4008739.1 MaoC family dehydratase [Anaerolineaceae bacterium]MCY4106892.1 MaoC family dehydratase [Chloroflexota bacterium]